MINLVFDYMSVNGYIANCINPKFHTKLFDLSFDTDKDNLAKTNLDGIDIVACEPALGLLNNRKVLISIIEDSIKSKNTLWLYPIGTMGLNHKSFGVQKEYRNENIFNFISKRALEYTEKYDNFKILIYTGLEHEMFLDYFKWIYIHLQDNNINPSNVYIVSNNFQNSDTNDYYLNKIGFTTDKKLNFITYYEQLKTKANEISDSKLSSSFLSENEIVSKKKYKCLLLNRRLHIHRKLLLSLIAQYDLFDGNMISFDLDYHNNNFGDNFEYDIKSDAYIASQDGKLLNKHEIKNELLENSLKYSILNGYKKLKKINKLSLDVSDLNSIDGRPQEIDDIDLYKKTYYSLVTETEFFERTNGYTTEKILKPIQQLHPFVVLGRPHVLKYLKEYGFKTFEDFWDESYDNEEHSLKRMMKVFELFIELNDKSDDEWLVILKKMKPILIHNRETLKKYSYKNDGNVINNLQKIISNEHNKENPTLLQKA